MKSIQKQNLAGFPENLLRDSKNQTGGSKNIIGEPKKTAGDPKNLTGLEDLLDSESPLGLEAQPAAESFSGFQAPIRNTRPSEILTLEEVYQRIKSPRYAAITQQLRGMTDKKQQREFKARAFDYVTFGGIFSQRKDSCLLQASNLMVFDFDNLGDDLVNVWNLLCNDPVLEVRLLYVSPSGNGIKYVVSHDPGVSSYGNYFQAVSRYLKSAYGLVPDATPDVSRACFISYDPDVYYG